MTSGIILYSLAIILVTLSFIKDRGKTAKALKKASMIFKNLLPEILAIMLFVGLSLAIMTPEIISGMIGAESGIIGVGVATIIGSIAMIPSFVVFPLGSTLLESGAGYPQIAAFVSAMMSVGIASLPMEKKVFGASFAIERNAWALLYTLLFTALIWVVYI
ncbi:hypothetical protein [Salisediminibacterium selenitireducens]|uniref:Permease n=1 Tax=Bacillus selenitireducens (strain ATCC 700615 / DSM 15326 / MLS10) TaxID=439292 RepID=D6XZR3_BACIE|nr:hypothetical protein [Salisediminibacterium selenitireducens]ADH98437.1 conserved hypothetical protein [[Bacillus] selenitireducens MLS10]